MVLLLVVGCGNVLVTSASELKTATINVNGFVEDLHAYAGENQLVCPET